MEKSEGYIFLSDAHLNDFDEHTEAFVLLLRNACKEKVEVFLLGDIFDLWFGKKTFTLPYQKKVIDEIASLSKRGMRVHYVEGNRDFFLVDSWVKRYFTTISDTDLGVTIGDKNLLLLHGDTVNKHDFQYRFWRSISKNSLVYSLFSFIPAGIALSFAGKFERSLKKTNPRFRYNFPKDEGKEFASEMFRKGIDLIIIGHYHREEVIEFSDHGPGKMFVCLPMWKLDRRYFYLSEEGRSGFKNFNPDDPVIG